MRTTPSALPRMIFRRRAGLLTYRMTAIGVVGAAALALAGAAVASSGMLDLVATSAPAFAQPWNNAATINARAVVHGYTVVVDKAYADADRVLVGVTVSAPETGVAPALGKTSLRDGSGTELIHATGMGVDELRATASLLSFEGSGSAVASQDYTLTVDSLAAGADVIQGPWVLRFRFQAEPGLELAPAQSDVVDGISVRVFERASVAPSSIVGEITVAGLPAGEGWAPIGRFVHGETSANIARSHAIASVEGETTLAFETVSGSEGQSGSWQLIVSELVGQTKAGQVRLAGPRVVTLSEAR